LYILGQWLEWKIDRLNFDYRFIVFVFFCTKCLFCFSSSPPLYYCHTWLYFFFHFVFFVCWYEEKNNNNIHPSRLLLYKQRKIDSWIKSLVFFSLMTHDKECCALFLKERVEINSKFIWSKSIQFKNNIFVKIIFNSNLMHFIVIVSLFSFVLISRETLGKWNDRFRLISLSKWLFD